MSLGVVCFVEVTGASADMSANVDLHPLPIVSLANSDIRPFDSHVSAQDIFVKVLHESLTNSPDLWDIESFRLMYLSPFRKMKPSRSTNFFVRVIIVLIFDFGHLLLSLSLGSKNFTSSFVEGLRVCASHIVLQLMP